MIIVAVFICRAGYCIRFCSLVCCLDTRCIIIRKSVTAFDYIFEPYWKQNKLVADEADKREYLEWKRKVLEDDGDNQ